MKGNVPPGDVPIPHRAQDPQGLKDEWGRWLTASFDRPDIWFTGTFDRPGRRVASGSATHSLVGWALSERLFGEVLSDWVGEDVTNANVAPSSPVWWVRGRESNKHNGGTHLHALIGGVSHLSRRALSDLWRERCGVVRVEKYDPALGAGWYVSKYVVKEFGDIQFSRNAALHLKGQASLYG